MSNKPISVSYAAAIYGQREIDAVVNVLNNPKKIVAGDAVKEFERQIAQLFGKNYGVMVNSGSSANLLAFEILDLPQGSEVITPVLTFSTTIAPIIQKGLVPVFADVDPGTYLINYDQIESLITEKTKALMIPSLVGNIPDFDKLRKIADDHNLYLIEDSADTLGGTYKGNPSGDLTDISTTSFYASHIITAAGGGGMICLNDEIFANRALVLSNWGRDSTLFGIHEASEDIEKRFKGSVEGSPYDAKFMFSQVGYNMQCTELEAAFGLVQLERLNEFSKTRLRNFTELMNYFTPFENLFVLPKQLDTVKTNWLAFPLVLKESAPFSREDIVRYLESKNIQTRPVFTGNILRQPAFSHINHRSLEDGYPVADSVMLGSLMIGCHHGMKDEDLDYIKLVFNEFLANF
jgi:CDP-4-dehydro-6-deoxyglucose reductase, E1